jgi:hypothetical protein
MNYTGYSLPVQADFRYLLTLRSGQSIALIHFGWHLGEALKKDGLNVQTCELEELTHSSTDAIFLAAPFTEALESVFGLCAKSLKPGGQALVCFPNGASIKRMKNRFHGKQAFSFARALSAAKAAGLIVTAVYGIHDHTEEPRFLIPLENRQAVTHFFRVMLTPYTSTARLLIGFAPLWIALGWHHALFPDLCLVAHAA